MTVDYSQQRQKMVDGQLRTTGVTSSAILDAMETVSRESFVPPSRRQLSYIDEDIVVSSADSGSPRYLMEPSPFARMLQLADIDKDDVVLDIGCGTGYSSAVLSCLAGSVIALESDHDMASRASSILTEQGYDNTVVVEGPLVDGFPSEAPYDVIFLNGAVEFVPDTLFDQLREKGRLVAIVGTGNTGVATLWYKLNDNVSSRREFNAAIRPLPGFQRSKAFEF